MWDRRGCVRVCVCYLQALADPLRLPGSAEDHSASVLKSGQLSNNRLPYIQAGPFQLKWATKKKNSITGRDLSGALPLVWSLTLWVIITPFMTWEEKHSLRQFLNKRPLRKNKLQWINERWYLTVLTGLWLECPLVISSNGLHSRDKPFKP